MTVGGSALLRDPAKNAGCYAILLPIPDEGEVFLTYPQLDPSTGDEGHWLGI